VRINEAHAVSLGDVLNDHVPEQGRFARTGLADDIGMVAPVGGGHAKSDGHLGHHWLKGRKGDQLNALLSAIGFNLRQLLSYLNEQKHPLPA